MQFISDFQVIEKYIKYQHQGEQLDFGFQPLMPPACWGGSLLWLRGFESFYCDLTGNHKYACSLMDKLLEIEMGYWNSIFSELGDYIDTVLTANDLGE